MNAPMWCPHCDFNATDAVSFDSDVPERQQAHEIVLQLVAHMYAEHDDDLSAAYATIALAHAPLGTTRLSASRVSAPMHAARTARSSKLRA